MSRPRYAWCVVVLIVGALALFAAGCGGGSSSSGGSGGAGIHEFVYVATGATTTGFAIAADGSLTAIAGSPFSGGGGSLAAHPSGRFTFSTTGTGDAAVDTNAVHSDGSLAKSSSVSDGTIAGGLSVNADGRTVYVGSTDAGAGNPGWNIYLAQSDGSLSFSAAVIDQTAGRLVFLSNGSFAYAASCFGSGANVEGFSTALDTLTFDGQFVPRLGLGTECARAVAITPTGALVAAVWSNAEAGPVSNFITVYTVDSKTHWLEPVSSVPFPASGAGADLVFDASGKFLVAAQDNGIGVYQINQNVVSEVSGSPFAGGTDFTRLKFSPSGRFLFAIGAQSQQLFVFTLNGSTGSLAPAAGSPNSITDANDLAVVQR